MLESIVGAGLAFWLIPFLVVYSILLIYWIDREYSGWATFSLLVAGAIVQWGFKIDLLGYILGHPWVVLYGSIGYFTVGTIWAITKWWFYVSGERRKYNEYRAKFLRSHKVEGNVIPDDLKQRFSEDMPRYGEDAIEIRPDVTQHKAQIYMWMAYWPFSALWTILNDPIRRIFRAIYARIRATLQRISDHEWAGTDQDFKN